MGQNRIGVMASKKAKRTIFFNSELSPTDENRTKLGVMADIEWGWLAHERRERRAHWFKLWDGVMAASVVLHVTMITFCAAFSPYDISLLVLGYVLDFFNCADFVAKVLRFYAHDLRNTEMRKGKSRLDQYARSWMIADLLALIPTDFLCLGWDTNHIMPALAYLRCNRLFCGYRVFRYLNFLESHVGANIVLLRGIYYTVLSWITLHMCACFWYLIPCSTWSSVRDGMKLCSGGSWIYTGGSAYSTANKNPEYGVTVLNRNIYEGFLDHGLGTTEYVHVNATVSEAYMYALYWTITTATTTGLGEVHAITLPEKLFSMFCQLVGTLVLFGIIQGGVTSILTNFDVNQFRYKMRVAAIIHYLRDQNQPSELVREVTNFYRYLWERSRGMSSAGLFDQLPFALRSEISLELTGRIFDKSPLFQNINASFLRMLSLKFRPMLALPDQIVMRKGELSNLMVYVQKGQLEVLSDDEHQVPVLLLKPGKLFGEINLITRMPRKYSIRAIAHCDLVVLRTEDLMECLVAYPEIADELRARAEERAGMREQQTEEGILASNETHESAKRKKQEMDLSAKLEELSSKTGTNMRSLMSACKIPRPQERLRVSESMELFRIRDPMDELVDFHTSQWKGRMISRYHFVRQAFLDFSLDPDGLFCYFWERLIVAMIVATFFLNTYVAFFGPFNTLLDEGSSGYVVFVFTYTMDIFFYVDFGLKFLTQITTANGKVSKHREMAVAFLKSWECWLDILALMPMEVFVASMGQGDGETAVDFYARQMHMLGYLRLNRCLRVFLLPKFFDKLSDQLTTSIAFVRTVKFCLYIAISSQLGAAILIAGTCGPEHCPTGDQVLNSISSWTSPAPPNITQDSLNPYRYTSALYYSVILLTSTGYGDIFPHSVMEQFLANVVMLIGLLVYGYCLAVLTATLANLDGPRVEFQERLFALKKFMEYNKMAELVKRRAIEAVALLWTISKGEDIPGVKSMTADLPPHLTEEIQVEDLIHLVAGVPIFKNIEEHILKSFAPAIRRYLFPPGEYIIQHGDLINELFVIRRGACQIFHPEQHTMVISELLPGMYFGEIGFLFNHNEIVSVKTVTHCEVLTIPRPAFDQAAASVRWFSHQMKLIAQNNKYYEDMCNAARQAKPLVKKRKEESPVRMSENQKRRLRFRDDFNSLSVSLFTLLTYRLLLNRTIDVSGRFLYIWEQVRLISATFVFILVLVQVTYQIVDLWLFVILYFFDIYAVVDIYIKFHVQYYNDTNILVVHPYMTARRYLKTNFWIDFLAVFPFELFLAMTPGGTVIRDDLLHASLYFRLNRTLQVYRIPLAFAFYESDIKKDQNVTFYLKFTNYFVLFVIWATAMPYTVQCPPSTCGMNVTACNVTDDTGQVVNTSASSCMDPLYLSLISINSTTSTWDQFVGGFYWAVTTVTVVGYGDVYATNQTEQVLFFLIMIIGYIFFNYIIASIAAAQANSDARRSRFFDRLKCIKQYTAHEHLSKKLRYRIVKYYEYLWLRTHGIDPQTLIVGLPPSLTAELALQLYRKVIEQVSIFKNTPTGFKKMLAAIMKPLYVMEGEYVIRVDDVGTDLFFVYRGGIEVFYANGVKVPQVVRSGRMLGEHAFFTHKTSRLSCKACENSDLYYVTRAEFDHILEHFPEIKEKLLEDIVSNFEKDDEFKNNSMVKSLAQQRRQRGGFRDSLAAVRRAKIPLTKQIKLWSKHTFRSDDKYIRYFSKYFVTTVRVVAVMLIFYQASFGDYHYGVHYIFEVVFFIYILLQFRIGFLDEFGNEVMNPKKIRQRYVKHGLLTDVIISFPYEIFAVLAPVGMRPKVWAYLRLLKIPANLARIFGFFRQWLAELDINVLFVRLTYSFVQLFLCLHFFCCVAYYIACPDAVCDMQNSWVQKVDHLSDAGPGQRYIVSLYWITTTATTCGYGDIVPLTNLERIFTCVVQVTGKFLFGIIVGDIASTLANLEIARQNFESRFQAIKTYLLDQQANRSIIDRVQKYFDYLWSTDRGVEDIKNVLNDAPFCLRTEITYAVHQRDLRELPLFREASDAFIRMVSACLHQVQFVPGDYIIQQGDLVEEMYFLHRGEAVEVESGVEITVVRRGSNVNWQSLLIDWPASRTVRATDNCEVYVLKRRDLDHVVAHYKDQMGHIVTTNRIRLRDLLEEEKVELD